MVSCKIPEPDKIMDSLFLGDLNSAKNLDSLLKLGITHVLSVGVKAVKNSNEFTYLRIFVEDDEEANIFTHFFKTFE